MLPVDGFAQGIAGEGVPLQGFSSHNPCFIERLLSSWLRKYHLVHAQQVQKSP